MLQKFSRYPYIVLTALLGVFILIVMGGVLSATGAGGACPDWPTCFGAWTPPPASLEQPLADYLHRFGTALATFFILAAVWRGKRSQPWIIRPLLAALGTLLVQVLLGAWMVLNPQAAGRAWISALHLGLSLIMLAALAVATVVAFVIRGRPSKDNEHRLVLSFASPFARLSLVTLVATFLLLVTGAAVAAGEATQACLGWPLCNGMQLPDNLVGWVNLSHRLVVGLAGILVAGLVWRAWLTQRTQTPVLVSATAVGALFFAQALMGAKMVQGFPPYLLVLHQATAVATWAALVVQVVTVGLAGRSSEQERVEAIAGRGSRWQVRDYLMLTKPIVVALLLVTTYAGMVIGAKAWPSFWLTFWTLLGGFMAAGGSGAINQYIDRADDLKMQRTQKRPIPSGRLTPGQGLAFGVGLALASFYLMAALVNFTAALLTLAGIIYYVLIYSLLLKKTTVQNIVIGGGAGAIPPLVGWAAATGGLNIPSLFLFAVVFMWTPPHFWALALVRRNDYARAGVPMLPVVRGERETRWQIFIYTLELVALTLLLPLFGLGGSVYLVGALALGGWLLLTAWKVWKQGGNRVAWKMYRYSSMYLAFLFVVLMVDALI